MEFYVIIVPPLILSLLMIFRLHKMAAQDRRIFAEHQELCELTKLILSNNFSLSKEYYVFLRRNIENKELKELIKQYIKTTHPTEDTKNATGLTLLPFRERLRKLKAAGKFLVYQLLPHPTKNSSLDKK